MRVGVVFPQTEIGSDPSGIRDFAQAVESLGYDHILAYDHVLGVNADSGAESLGKYKHTDTFHEPFVLFSYLAGITERIEFVSGIIILPQRQTALVAKQAAALDVLSKGRLRLGVGIGWNPVEYEALGENFKNRGRRSEEQIDLLRQLWTNDIVTYEGKWHRVTDAGINPLPVQRPIPIWFGGTSDVVMRRLARIGDGWFPQRFGPDDTGRREFEKLRGYIEDAGRDPSDVGIEPRISIGTGSPEDWLNEAENWKKLGVSHISVVTMDAGLSNPQEHINAIDKFMSVAQSL